MADIPFDQRDGFIWLNGKIVPWKEAKTHILSHVIHYGSGVFEGERMYNGKIFKSVEHSERLHNSANLLGMKIPNSVEELEKAKYEICKLNNVTEGYIRAHAWRGAEQIGIGASKTKTHVAIAAWTWGTYFDPSKRDKGINIMTSKWRRPGNQSAPVQSKASGLYVICTMSKHDAEAAGYDDAFMLDHRGYVAELTSANVFGVKDGTLLTPKPDHFLNGITRQTVLGLAKDMNIPIEERDITPEEFKVCDEIFVTGTAAEVTAVGKIDDQEYLVGPVTKKLREAYEALVRA
ncbi:MAG: branched-chain amino acid aminotransferase [Alphaproteobacteria bacterium]|nr:branched-chain amino acid aminotransferase [Alphaproteobacteria bacterium]